MSLMHKPRGSHVTNFEKLWTLCDQLPAAYRDQSRARLSNAVERMTLREADERLGLRLDQHGVLPCDHPDHEDGVSCLERAVGCSMNCHCCMGYERA